MEKNLKKKGQIDIRVYVNHFALHLKLTQYYKLTMFQFLKKAETNYKQNKGGQGPAGICGQTLFVTVSDCKD